MVDATVEKRVRGKAVYFTVTWSPFASGDKYHVVTSVPSMGGMYELYFQDDRGKLVLLERNRAWYGGLRARIRRAVDIELQESPQVRKILEEYKLYYRYTLHENRDDLIDLLYFFSRVRDPKGTGYMHSGRYATIYVKEISANKIVTI
jgi:hypothetical protein